MRFQTIPILMILFLQLFRPAWLTGEPFPEAEAASVTQTLQLAFSEEAPPKEGILCFDADENGWIALGTEARGQKWISIYDADMVFQYAISFHTDGSFLVFLEEGHVWLYLIRGDLCVEIDAKGQSVSVWELKGYRDNIAPLLNQGRSPRREVNGYVYELSNKSRILNLTGKASVLSVSSAEGGERILYDVSDTMGLRLGFGLFLGLSLFALIVGVVVDHRKKKDA